MAKSQGSPGLSNGIFSPSGASTESDSLASNDGLAAPSMLQDSHQNSIEHENEAGPESAMSSPVVSTEILFLLFKQLQASQERTDRLLERLVDNRMVGSKPPVPRYC